MASNKEYDNDPDISIGIKLPIQFGKTGFWDKTSTTLEQAEYNIKNLLLTKFGERFGHPDFGCELANLNFEQLEDDIMVKADEAINEAVSKWLPYLNIVDIESEINTAANRLNIKVTYSLKTDPTESNSAIVTYS
jgi:phage baseplate assembly protein W|tara:strand:- start:376 stop:780 length:405 start_codon:yes stop_codon:yes gene_type:complete